MCDAPVALELAVSTGLAVDGFTSPLGSRRPGVCVLGVLGGGAWGERASLFYTRLERDPRGGGIAIALGSRHLPVDLCNQDERSKANAE